MEYRITPGRLEVGKFSLYYERVGAGAPIVFLHGLGGNHLSWWQQVPYFMRSFECVTVDQRGFGLSPDPDGVFNRAHSSDLGALLDYLKIDKAVLVGQSMGGWTIVGYALEHPERVAAMVMADTPGGIFTPEMKFEAPRVPLPVDASPPIGSLPPMPPTTSRSIPRWLFCTKKSVFTAPVLPPTRARDWPACATISPQ